jgi:hypothetical protein
MAVTDDQVAALRGVLGDRQAIFPLEEDRVRAQFLLLAALTVTLDPRELDQVSAEGRSRRPVVISEGTRSLMTRGRVASGGDRQTVLLSSGWLNRITERFPPWHEIAG